MQYITKKLQNWSENNGMIINKSKSGIMFIKKSDNEKNRKKFNRILFGYPIVE